MKTNVLNQKGLKKVLAINAIFSGLSGALMSVGAQPLSRLMGIHHPLSLLIVGINLIFFALFLAWLVRLPSVPRLLAWGVIGSDILWVLASVLGLIMIPHMLTRTGVFLVIDVAGIVAGFAAAQIYCLTRSGVHSQE